MSWDVVIFNSAEKIESVETLDENKLIPIDFCSILAKHYPDIICNENYWEIAGDGFAINYYTDKEEISNKIFNLYGEVALFELVKICKLYNWQIFDTGNGEMLDLDKPGQNGFEEYQSYLQHVLNTR